MYSMVLMAALTTGTDMPDWGRRGGCCGCYGGWGGGYGGYGWGGWGRGGWGGWGGGWGGYGGGWGGWGGGWGGWGYVAAPVVPPIYAAPTVLVSNPLPAATAVTRSMYYNPGSAAGNRATITVHLPERATLIVDGKPTTSISNIRRFYSPPLEPGKSYHYNLTALMERDGKTVKANRRVDVTAGANREITITLPDLNQPPDSEQPGNPAARKPSRDRRPIGG